MMEDVIILEYSGGGAELAAPLPESARRLCIHAAMCYSAGKEKTARDIFLQLISGRVPPRLRKKLKHYPVVRLARLAAILLNGNPVQEPDPAELRAAENRLKNR